MDRREYLDERKILIEMESEGARSFDKAILTLGTGALALSLAFIEKIVPSIKAGTKVFLMLAWGALCVSVISTLSSFLTSQTACLRQRNILDMKYLVEKSGKKLTSEEEDNQWALWTKRLNIFSMVTFFIGVIFLVIFSFSNLEVKMTDDSKGKELHTGGVVPPKTPATPAKIEKGIILPKPSTDVRESKKFGSIPPKPPQPKK